MKSISLKYKIIFFTLFAITSTLIFLGFVIDKQLKAEFNRDAKRKHIKILQTIGDELQSIETSLAQKTNILSEDELLIASLHMINTYEDIHNYNAILFDEEKKNIISILARDSRYAKEGHIAIYDKNRHLVAFIDHEEHEKFQGYTSYKEGQPRFFIKREHTKEFTAEPKHMDFSYTLNTKLKFENSLFKYRQGILDYRISFNTLMALSENTIVRKSLSGKQELVGYIQINKFLTREDIKKVTKQQHTNVNYEIMDPKKVTQAYHQAPLLFSELTSDNLILKDTDNLSLSFAQIPVDKHHVVITASIEKTVINQTLIKNRKTFLFILLLTLFIIGTVSIILLNHILSQPLAKLMQGIKILREGDYHKPVDISSHDELGSIAQQFNIMASTIHKRELALDKLAFHDPLTSLPNRSMFFDKVQTAISRAQRIESKFAVLFFDLDRFKEINDTLGHDIGDKVLIHVAESLNHLLRDNDLIARIGGDEYNILVEDIKEHQEVANIATKILDYFKEPIKIGHESMQLSGSIGITIYPDDGESLATLLKNADMAMYNAKAQGRDQYCFYAMDMSEKLHKRTAMLQALAYALKNGEFEVYYQPKFSIASRQVHAAEALVRWNSSQFGFVTPDSFIPLLEESGLIVEVGAWIMERACQDFQIWQSLDLGIKQISVNVSNVQFSHSDVATTVKEVLLSTGIEAKNLELEMTESYISENSETATQTLHEIRALGVDLAIDDFGTGYSSISYLKNLPLTRLKIDKSFVDGIPHDNNDIEITKVIIAFANVMKLNITAEGIELMEQLTYLHELNVDEGQGYLCSKPVNFNDFCKFVAENSYFCDK